jgi:hypothetical protein
MTTKKKLGKGVNPEDWMPLLPGSEKEEKEKKNSFLFEVGFASKHPHSLPKCRSGSNS